jgi:radical SAM superfamily enzyme YgiQ (UPF0313 family)
MNPSRRVKGVSAVRGGYSGAAGDRLDLLLVYPPWAVPEKRGILQNSLPPLGLLSIASYAEAKGYHVGVLDVHAERLDDKEVAERLRTAKPRYVGISVLTNMAIPAHYIARLSKRIVPDCMVIAGGVHAEAMPEEMLRNSAIDAVVRGDGEAAMIEVLSGKPFSDVKGLTYREGHRIVHNPPRPVEMNLDCLPFPAYHLVNFKNYFPAVASYRNLPAINMLMTRGCPGKCTFCNSAFTTLRSRSAESMIEEIKLLRYRYGIRQIQFYDDTFTVAKKNALAFCKKMIEDKVDVTWTAYIRGDCFNEEMASAMKAAGCHQVLIGVETGDEQIMRNIQKPIDKARYSRTVEIAHHHGIEVRASFIIGNIGETMRTMEATVRFAKELDVDLFQLNISTPYPGTQLYKYAIEHGLLKHKNWSEYGQGRVLVHLSDLPEEQIYRFEKSAFRSFYLRPKMVLRQLRRVVHLRHLRDLFSAFMALILGVVKYRNPKWKCWNVRGEEDFQDLDLVVAEKPRLTFEARQGAIFS